MGSGGVHARTHARTDRGVLLGVGNYSVDIKGIVGLEVDAVVMFPYYDPWKRIWSENP